MNGFDALDVAALLWCLLFLLLIGLLWLCGRLSQRRRNAPPESTAAPRNCRQVRGDEWEVGESRPRFGGHR
jgi:hypothetical protein